MLPSISNSKGADKSKPKIWSVLISVIKLTGSRSELSVEDTVRLREVENPDSKSEGATT